MTAVRRRPALLLALAFVAVELTVASRYGYFRDELYFLSCGRRLALGYVDQPPLVPFLAWLDLVLLDGALLGLRALAALAGGATVVLTAAIARELGGGTRAQVLAAAAVATSTLLLANAHVLTTATYDTVAWAGIALLAARMLRTGERRWWLPIGAVAGLGLLNNYRVALLLAGLVAALLLARRGALLRSGWVLAGAAVCTALVAPTVLWQATHGWPVLAWLAGLRAQSAADHDAVTFLLGQVLHVSPALAPIWLTGLWWLLSAPEARAQRALAWCYLILIVVVAVLRGQPYYVGPLYTVLFAAGGLALERGLRGRSARGVRATVAAMLGLAVLSSPFALPVLPAHTLRDTPLEEVPPLVETVGWPELVDTVAAVVEALPAEARRHAVVFAADYGEASALEQLGAGRLGVPVVSGHNSWALWGPGPPDTRAVVTVGVTRARLVNDFATVRAAGVVGNTAGVRNRAAGASVLVASEPRRQWSQIWSDLRHFGR